jgi:hypothetical protein
MADEENRNLVGSDSGPLPLTSADRVCLKMGREIVRMIADLERAAGKDAGYARRTLTYRGGSVELLLVNQKALADLFERAAAREMDVADATPLSQLN